MIGSICSEPRVLEVMRLVNIIISIVRIAVPIILILSAMIKVVRIVTNPDKEWESSRKSIISSTIAAVLIFLMPTFISIIFNVTSSNKDYKNCLEVKTVEQINEAYNRVAEDLVSEAEKTNNPSDYYTAHSYLSNIKDDAKRKEYEDRLEVVKKRIDEKEERPNNNSNNGGPNIDNANIPVTPEIRAACGIMLNADTVKVRLTACSGPHALDNPQDLPGGATQNSSGSWVANRAIPFSQYRMGMFFGEIGAAQFDSRQNFFQTFSIMYTTVFLKSVVPNLIASGQANNYSQEIGYLSGECSQVYKESQHEMYYVSGAYKNIIDEATNATKYYILVNTDGSLVNVRYNTTSGILGVMYNAAKEGRDIHGILNAMRSGHTFADNYKNAVIYDCRNVK